MLRRFLKSKLHQARVTRTDIGYEGSLSIDPRLLDVARLLPYEQIEVYNISNGARFTTYAIPGEKSGNGEICVNGAAARLVVPGDPIIVVSYVSLEENEIAGHRPVTVLLDENNRPRA